MDPSPALHTPGHQDRPRPQPRSHPRPSPSAHTHSTRKTYSPSPNTGPGTYSHTTLGPRPLELLRVALMRGDLDDMRNDLARALRRNDVPRDVLASLVYGLRGIGIGFESAARALGGGFGGVGGAGAGDSKCRYGYGYGYRGGGEGGNGGNGGGYGRRDNWEVGGGDVSVTREERREEGCPGVDATTQQWNRDTSADANTKKHALDGGALGDRIPLRDATQDPPRVGPRKRPPTDDCPPRPRRTPVRSPARARVQEPAPALARPASRSRIQGTSARKMMSTAKEEVLDKENVYENTVAPGLVGSSESCTAIVQAQANARSEKPPRWKHTRNGGGGGGKRWETRR